MGCDKALQKRLVLADQASDLKCVSYIYILQWWAATAAPLQPRLQSFMKCQGVADTHLFRAATKLKMNSCPLSLHFKDEQLRQWQHVSHPQSHHNQITTALGVHLLLRQCDKHGRRQDRVSGEEEKRKILLANVKDVFLRFHGWVGAARSYCL